MSQTGFVLILLDDDPHAAALRDAIRESYGHACRVETRVSEALDSIRVRQPDVVVSAPIVGDEPALAPLVELLEGVAPDATLVLLADERSSLPARRDARVVAIDPKLELDELADQVAAAVTKAVARRTDRDLKRSLEEYRGDVFEGIVGLSPAIRKITARVQKIAPSNLTVLILGETGTGKELIAEAIHRRSPRARKPFKPVNCAGLSESLLESELFGHVRGAFTGATTDRKGYFLAADGGTLFLDEVGDMPMPMQAKLLRALERREITPVGSTDVRHVDVRVIAATHQDLRKQIEERRFREDLYYRLNTCVIEAPPLRERRGDIPLLADWLLRRHNREQGVSVPGISSAATAYLTRYFWPGNVRELSNVLAEVAVEVGDRQIEAEDLPEHIRGTRELAVRGLGSIAGLTMSEIERLAIERALAATNGNREQAAKLLNIGIRTLYRKIKEFRL